MATYYVIQIWAYHGSGMQGWRTASRQAGVPYRFRNRDAAEAAMREHFGNLREGTGVRVHEITDSPTPEAQPTPGARPYAGGADGSQRQ